MTLVAGSRFDVAEALLGRDTEGRIAVEAKRPKCDTWHLEVDADLARSSMGQVARHHFTGGDLDGDTWLVHHKYAERLVEALAHHDESALLALVAESINEAAELSQNKEN